MKRFLSFPQNQLIIKKRKGQQKKILYFNSFSKYKKNSLATSEEFIIIEQQRNPLGEI